MKPSRRHCRRILPLASASLLSIALVQTASATVSVVPELITLGGTNGLINIYEVDLEQLGMMDPVMVEGVPDGGRDSASPRAVGYSVDIVDDSSDLVISNLVISFSAESMPEILIRPDLEMAGAAAEAYPSFMWEFLAMEFFGLDVSFSDAFNSEDNAFLVIGTGFGGLPRIMEDEIPIEGPMMMGDYPERPPENEFSEPSSFGAFITTENDIDGPPNVEGGDFEIHFLRGGFVASDFIALDPFGMVVSSSGALSAVPEPSSTLLISAIMSAGMLFRFRPRR